MLYLTRNTALKLVSTSNMFFFEFTIRLSVSELERDSTQLSPWYGKLPSSPSRPFIGWLWDWTTDFLVAN